MCPTTVRRTLSRLFALAFASLFAAGVQAAIPQLAAGELHSLALHADGTVYAWGDNTYGQLGNGQSGEGRLSALPVRVQGLTDIIAIASRANQNLALRADGTLWAWGRNDQGQLGDGSQTDRTTPVRVSGLTEVVAIAAGWQHSLAVRADGSLWVWGANDGGRFGNGSEGWGERSTVPIPVPDLTGVVAAAGGYAQSFAIRNDGSLWAWGVNSDGLLGLGTFTDTETVPVQVASLGAVSRIATQAEHVLAQTRDGRLWAWGSSNEFGQFGDGATTASALPVLVQRQPAGDPTALAVGWVHSVVRLADGQVWTWGNNWYGQLGLGEGEHQGFPVRVAALNGVETIAAGARHSLASMRDGSVWAWGIASQGQLGLGDDRLYVESLPQRVLDSSGTDFLYLGQTPALYHRKVRAYFHGGLGRAPTAEELDTWSLVLRDNTGSVWRPAGAGLQVHLSDLVGWGTATPTPVEARAMVEAVLVNLFGTARGIDGRIPDYYVAQLTGGSIRARGLVNAVLNDLAIMPRADGTYGKPNGWTGGPGEGLLSQAQISAYRSRVE